jgi:hypothetical protein
VLEALRRGAAFPQQFEPITDTCLRAHFFCAILQA